MACHAPALHVHGSASASCGAPVHLHACSTVPLLHNAYTDPCPRFAGQVWHLGRAGPSRSSTRPRSSCQRSRSEPTYWLQLRSRLAERPHGGQESVKKASVPAKRFQHFCCAAVEKWQRFKGEAHSACFVILHCAPCSHCCNAILFKCVSCQVQLSSLCVESWTGLAIQVHPVEMCMWRCCRAAKVEVLPSRTLPHP
jgi:hypothetical protein